MVNCGGVDQRGVVRGEGQLIDERIRVANIHAHRLGRGEHLILAVGIPDGAYHAADAKDVSKLAGDLRDAIQGKQWMCGFPDKLVIFTYDQYVVSLYGDEELVNTFRDKFTATYSDSTIAYDEAIL